MDIFRFPNLTEEEIRSAEERNRSATSPVERPRGYGSRNGFDSFVLTLIAPGEKGLFQRAREPREQELAFRDSFPARGAEQ